MIASLVGLICASALQGLEAPPDSLVEKAEEFVSVVLDAPWEVTFRDWADAQEGAVCTLVGNDPYPHHAPDGVWCYRCDQDSQDYRFDFFFYESLAADSSLCYLRQVRSSAPFASEEATRTLLLAARQRITARLGPPDPISEDSFHPAILWNVSEVSIWRRENLSLVLGMGRHDHAVELRGFHGELNRALRESVRFRIWTENLSNPWFVDDPVRLERWILARAREVEPVLHRLRPSRPLSRNNGEGLLSALRVLLSPERDRTTELTATLLLVADGLATELQWLLPDQPAPLSAWLSFPVEDHELTYEYDQLGSGWVYRHDLLWEVWQRFGETDAGESAFVQLLERGWDTSCCCEKGSDQFRDVIREGESLLRERPASPERASVLLAVALAYGTWWSLSQS